MRVTNTGYIYIAMVISYYNIASAEYVDSITYHYT